MPLLICLLLPLPCLPICHMTPLVSMGSCWWTDQHTLSKGPFLLCNSFSGGFQNSLCIFWWFHQVQPDPLPVHGDQLRHGPCQLHQKWVNSITNWLKIITWVIWHFMFVLQDLGLLFTKVRQPVDDLILFKPILTSFYLDPSARLFFVVQVHLILHLSIAIFSSFPTLYFLSTLNSWKDSRLSMLNCSLSLNVTIGHPLYRMRGNYCPITFIEVLLKK